MRVPAMLGMLTMFGRRIAAVSSPRVRTRGGLVSISPRAPHNLVPFRYLGDLDEVMHIAVSDLSGEEAIGSPSVDQESPERVPAPDAPLQAF